MGPLPFPSFGAGATFTIGERPRWELGAWYWLAREREVPTGKGPSAVDMKLASIRASVCVPLAERSPFELCPAFELGRIDGQSHGALRDPDTGQAWWLGLSGGLAARIPISSRVTLRARFDIGVPLFRPNFVIENTPSGAPDGVWRPESVFGILSVGPEVDFSPRITRPPAM